MSDADFHLLVECSHCGLRQECGPVQITKIMGASRLLKGERWSYDALRELAIASAGRLRCPECGELGCRIEEISEEANWLEAKRCSNCGEVIEAERLEFFPNALLCVPCQQREETGELLLEEQEYCPNCGSLMKLRSVSRGGLSRYAMVCTGNPRCR